MFDWLRSLTGRNIAADDGGDFDYEGPAPRQNRDSGSIELRRWDGAQTDRLTQNAFANVTGRSINSDLQANLRTLLTRCTFEATTNGTIEGMVDSNVLDLLSPDGPSILVLPRNPVGMSEQEMAAFAEYQTAAEEYLEEWAKCPDVNAEMSFYEILSLEIIANWTTGNSFTQITTKQGQWDKCVGDIRLHPIHAERVLQNYHADLESGNQFFLGMELNKFGKKLNYFVRDTLPQDSSYGTYEATPVSFHNMIHGYRRLEPGQIAGVPLLASSLHDIASLKQFDRLTLNAAASAAAMGVVFEDAFDGVAPVKRAASGRSESVKFAGAQLIHAPKGKRAKTVGSEHPASNYVEFRSERWKDIGRPAQMPKLIARLDASGLSYSAARMEQGLYSRSIRRGQQTVRRRYSPVLSDVLRDAELSGKIPMRPAQIEIGMSFAGLPSADPMKDAKQRQVDLETMSKSLLDVWAESGTRPRDQVDKMRRTVQMLNDISPGFGEKYLEQLVASKPDTVDAAAMAGHPLPGDDPDADELADQIDDMVGTVEEN